MLHPLRVPRVARVFIDLLLSVFHLEGVGVYLRLLCHATKGLKFFEDRVSKDTNC